MASTGNVLPSSGANGVTGVGTSWTSPGNITADDGLDATCTAAGTGSEQLVASGFGFSIPTGATIVGVTLRVEASEHSGGTENLFAQLRTSSGLIGTSKAAVLNGTTKAIYTYGGTSDVWGATLTTTTVNDSSFGVALQFLTNHQVRIDYVTLAVEYTPAPTAALATTVISVAVAAVLTAATHADASLTVPVTLSSAGTVAMVAQAAGTVDVSLSSAGGVRVGGQAAPAVPVTLSSAGTVAVKGTSSPTVAVGLFSAGARPVQGGFRFRPGWPLGMGAIASAGTAGASITLGSVTLASAGGVGVAGAASGTISVSASAAGTVPRTGALSATIPILLASAAAPGIGGVLDVLPVSVGLSSVGTVPVQGASSPTVSVSMASAGTVPRSGAASITLGDVTTESSGNALVGYGAAAITIDAITLSSVATRRTNAQGSGEVSVALTSAGSVPRTGEGAPSAVDVSLTSAGAVAVQGQGAITLDAITIASIMGNAPTGTPQLWSPGLLECEGPQVTLYIVDAVPTATSYEIQRFGDAEPDGVTIYLSTDRPTVGDPFVDEPRRIGQGVLYRARALNGAGAGPWGAAIEATPCHPDGTAGACACTWSPRTPLDCDYEPMDRCP